MPYSEVTFNRKKSILLGANRYSADLLLETLKDMQDALQDESLAPKVIAFLTENFGMALSATRIHVAEQIDLHQTYSVKNGYLALLTGLLNDGKITEEAYYISIAPLSILTKEQKLLCIRHGINKIQNFNVINFFNLINQKISSGDQALITEILNPETALSTFIKAKLSCPEFLKSHEFEHFISSALELCKLSISSNNTNRLPGLLKFFESEIIFSNNLHKDTNFKTIDFIAQRMNHINCHNFINLLELIADYYPSETLDHLKLSAIHNDIENNQNFGINLLMNINPLHEWPIDNGDLIEKYISLLELINRKNPTDYRPKIQTLLDPHPSNIKSCSFSIFLSSRFYQRADLLFRLMLNQFLSASVLNSLAFVKNKIAQALIQHSHRLEKTEAVAVLSDALNPESHLGTYFYLQRGRSPCSLEHGTLSILLAELRARDPEAAARIVEAHRPATESSMIADTHTHSKFFSFFHRRERAGSVDTPHKRVPDGEEVGVELALIHRN